MYPVKDISRSLPVARRVKDFSLDRFTGLIVHKTDASQSTPESTARFHTGPERKWSHIAYHFYMATDGTLYQTLPLSWIGIHAPPNFARVGLVLVGRCADPMSDAQREGLPLALDEILNRINAGRNGKAPLTLANVWGHNEVMPGHTDCPGADVLSFLAQAKALPLPTP